MSAGPLQPQALPAAGRVFREVCSTGLSTEKLPFRIEHAASQKVPSP